MVGRLSILKGVLCEGIMEYCEKHERRIVPDLIILYFSPSCSCIH